MGIVVLVSHICRPQCILGSWKLESGLRCVGVRFLPPLSKLLLTWYRSKHLHNIHRDGFHFHKIILKPLLIITFLSHPCVMFNNSEFSQHLSVYSICYWMDREHPRNAGGEAIYPESDVLPSLKTVGSPCIHMLIYIYQ